MNLFKLETIVGYLWDCKGSWQQQMKVEFQEKYNAHMDFLINRKLNRRKPGDTRVFGRKEGMWSPWSFEQSLLWVLKSHRGWIGSYINMSISGDMTIMMSRTVALRLLKFLQSSECQNVMKMPNVVCQMDETEGKLKTLKVQGLTSNSEHVRPHRVRCLVTLPGVRKCPLF